MALFKTIVFNRGTTVVFLTTFTDQQGNVIQPSNAQVSIAFNNATGQGKGSILVPMLPPGNPGGDATQWYAAWDSRNAFAGPVYWSIHSATPIPVVVQDGMFNLTANPANLISF